MKKNRTTTTKKPRFKIHALLVAREFTLHKGLMWPFLEVQGYMACLKDFHYQTLSKK